MAAGNQEDDVYNCEICHVKFETPQTYFAHVYSISHLQRVNAAENKMNYSSLPKTGVVTASATATSGEKGQSGLVSFSQKSSDPVVSVLQRNVSEGSESLHWSVSPAPGASKDFARREASIPFAQVDLGTIPFPGVTDTQAAPFHSKSTLFPATSSQPTGAASQDAVGRDQIADMSRGTMEVKASCSGALGAVATEAVPLPLGMCAASGPPSTGNVSGASIVAGVVHQLGQIQPSGNAAMETVPGKSTVCPSLSSNNPSSLLLGKVSLASFAASPATVGSDGSASVKDGQPSATVGSVSAVAVPCTKAKQDVEPVDDDEAILARAIDRAMAKDAATSSQLVPQPQMKSEDNSNKDAEIPKTEVDTKPSTIRPLMSSSSLSAAGPSGPKTTAVSGPMSSTGVQRTVPYTYDPLMPPVKVPLLPIPSTGFVPNPGYEGWNNSGPVVPLMEPPEPVFHHGPKVPLLRSPVSPFGSFPATFPSPGGTYFSGPLLPTPVPPVRAPMRPLMDPPVPAALGSRARPPRNWESENSGFDPIGVEVMDYHHGFPKKTGARAFHTPHEENDHFANLSVGHQIEPLMIGNWVHRTKPREEIKMDYACHICEVSCDDFFMHELHMAGLRHRQMAEGSFRKPVMASESKAHARVFKPEENAESAGHSPAFVTGLLDARRGPVSSASVTSTSSSSSSSGCFSELEKKLQVHAGPVLGTDYLTEYRYLGGRLEYTCDLCDVNLDSVSSVVEHVSGTDHLLQFMCYNNPETYRMIAGKAFDKDEVRQSAEKIVNTVGRQNRVRVKMESDDVSSDGRFAWIELKDNSVKPVASLPGHRLSNCYATIVPSRTTVAVDDIDSLLRTVSLHSCLLANRPPSQLRPLKRMDFLNALGKFEMQSSRDADICLQLANFLTIAVISFRRQMLPSLNAVDVTKIEEKLKNLHKNARIVAAKVTSSVSSAEVS